MADMPRLVQPMLAALRRQLPADADRYGWEFKWDGVRAVAYVSGDRVRLLSRNGKDMTASYPEVGVLAGRVDAPVILDGEIVALHEGRPDFGVLQSRMHVRRPRARLIETVPVQLYVFDLLYRGEDSLLGLPYTGRRARPLGVRISSRRYVHPAAGLLRSRSKLMPAERHRCMAASTSVTPICQVSTLGGSLAASAFWMPKCTVSVPKPMNSGYSGPS
jgi:hypothetical protein